jgi:putative membrane protein
LITGIINALLYFIISAIVVYGTLRLEDLLTRRYRIWDEIAAGNSAVATMVSGKILGLGIIAMFAIQNNEHIQDSVIWTLIGAVLLQAGSFLFEAATPRLSVSGELKAGNRAVGIVAAGISVGLAVIVGACIT